MNSLVYRGVAVRSENTQPSVKFGRRDAKWDTEGERDRLRQVSAAYAQSWLLPACARAPASERQLARLS